MKMPRTRAQVKVKQRDAKKPRRARKRFTNVVVNCDPFDLIDFHQTEMGNIEQMSSSVVPEDKQKIREGSSARTRVYNRPAGKKLNQIEKTILLEDDVMIIEEKIVNQASIFKPKPTWITHTVFRPVGGSVSSSEEGSSTDKPSSQEGSDVGVAVDCASKEETKCSSKSLKKIDLPRYLLNPNAFENNPAEKERILKSIYDKNRREADMKNKLSLLKQENMYLRRMLLLTASKNQEKVGGVVISPRPRASSTISPRPPVVTTTPISLATNISPTESIFNSFQTGTAFLPKPPSKKIVEVPTKNTLPLGLESVQNDNPENIKHLPPPPVPLPKRQRRVPCKPRQRKNVEKEPSLEERKEFIRNLYKKFDEEEDEDIDSIVASLIGPIPPQPSSTATNPIVHSDDAENKGKKRKQVTILENIKESVICQEADCSDDIQVIQEIEFPAKVAMKKLTEKYADVIFEATL